MSENTPLTHTHEGAFAGMHSHDGGALHWHDEFGEHMAEGLSDEERAARQLDWRMHNVQLVTVGIDIGSSTSHLIFSKIFVQLVGEGTNIHSVVVGREILWQSPIIFTPYIDAETIDMVTLRQFVTEAYHEVGATLNEVDTGAIILTGEALKRNNARGIAELFATETGKFVCASAGHHLEAVLAANGSGTVARSRRDQRRLLNVDIGGGTTKFAVVQDGEILATAAVAIGARLLVMDQDRRLTRIDEPARKVADRLGISLVMGEAVSTADEVRIAETWRDVLAGIIEGRPADDLTTELMLTAPLPDDVRPQALTFSGGVSEFIFLRETRDFGDLGASLAKALRDALSNGGITLPSIIDPNLGIRATAIGTSLFTTHVGINVYITNEDMLPLLNVPVLVPRLDLERDVTALEVARAVREALERADLDDGDQPVALSFLWADDLIEDRVRALAQGIRDGLPATIERRVPFVLMVDYTVSRALGKALKEDVGVPGDVLSLEGVSPSEFDFIDIAPVVHPSDVVPITIKSLLFAGGLDRRSVKKALLDAATLHT